MNGDPMTTRPRFLLGPSLLLLVFGLTLPTPAGADDDDRGGDVQLSLQQYEELVAASRTAPDLPPDAPGAYALGQAAVSVTVRPGGGAGSATVVLDLSVQVLEDGWVGVPLLPAGTAVTDSRVGGAPMQLVPGRGALLWGVESKGTYAVHLEYEVDARASSGGRSVLIPLAGVATRLEATLPGDHLDVTAIPSSALTAVDGGGSTRVTAAIPPSPGVQLTWQTPSERGATISRAHYEGSLSGDAITWTARYGVEVVGEGTVPLPLLPRDVVLVALSVDGEASPIEVTDGLFGTRLRGAGEHTVEAVFRVPVSRGDGPAGATITIPEVPVSRFELSLPGEMQVVVDPGTGVETRSSKGRTVASVNVPLSSEVRFTWSEAVPEILSEEVRANASIFHAVHAEEGVLYVLGTVALEVTRGATNRFEFSVPAGAQINSIEAAGGGVADWRVVRGGRDDPGVATVFFNREVGGEFRFDVRYEALIGSGEEARKNITVPLLEGRGVHRQRGMVALLASKELTLSPLLEEGLNRVGENQLPAFVREAVDMTIAHTFKYVATPPTLAVEATIPEREDGRFDASVDTLISLGDVTLQGAATIEVNVKSGSLASLRITLPPDVNFGSLSAPSMRSYELSDVPGGTAIDVAFTQELEGQFRVELSYEQLLGDAEGDLAVPTLAVHGAEVEQGRIAVEALSAVEVSASAAEHLSSVDVTELPRQLVLRTTNPILLAYKYVQVDPPYRLALKVTRHTEIDVQAATIDLATYRTLFTRDGLAVTTARFDVRNRREQFLRVHLPEGSEIWSASVNGEAEKPALAGADTDSPEVLIGIINSDQGFPVELVYATPVRKLRLFGSVKTELPNPDMVVTRSQLDVLLPDSLRYGRASGDMDLVVAGAMAGGAGEPMINPGVEPSPGRGPLPIAVPETGVRYSFTKLYANQRDERVTVSVAYRTPGTRTAGVSLLLLLLAGGGLGLGRRFGPRIWARWADATEEEPTVTDEATEADEPTEPGDEGTEGE